MRIANSIWLYLVWLAIYALLSNEIPGAQPVGLPWPSYFEQLYTPQTPLWFVLFLALHIATITTLHKVHPAVILVGAAALSWFSIRMQLPPEFAIVERGLYYLFFFALGVYGKNILIYFGSRRGRWWRVPVMLAITYVAIDALEHTELTVGYLGVILLRDTSAILCIVAVMSAVCMVPVLAQFLGFIGSRTLPAYVMHVPVIWGLIKLRDYFEPAFDIWVVRMATPLLAVAACLTASIGLYALAKRFAIGRLFFELPPFIVRTIVGTDSKSRPLA